MVDIYQSRVVIESNTYNTSGANLFGYSVKRDLKQFWATAIVEVPLSYDSIINNGDEVTITRGTAAETTTKIFYGTVEDKRVDGKTLKLICYDPIYGLKTKLANTSYTSTDAFAGRFDLIIEDLVVTYGELTCSCVDLSTADVLRKLVLIEEPVYETIINLMKVLDLHMYYNPSDSTVYVNYKGWQTYSTTFTTGTNINGIPKWSVDTLHAYNFIKVVGGKQLNRTQESFDGDGATVNFTLAYVPIDVKVTVGGTEKTAGREYSTTTYDYLVDDDFNVKQIQFTVASTPGVGVANVVVDYTYNTPIDVEAEDLASQGTLGVRKRKLVRPYIKKVLDAEILAYSILDKYKDGFINVTFQALNTDTLPTTGEFISINDSANNKNGTYICTSMEITFPNAVCNVTIGELFRDVEDFATTTDERIRKLEEEQMTNIDLIRKNYRPVVPLKTIVSYYMTYYPTSATSYWGLTTWGGGTWGTWVGYGDDFSVDNTATNWNASVGTWAINSTRQTYEQTNTGVNALSLWKYTGNASFTDIQLDTQLRYGSTGTEVGVVFRYSSSTTTGYAVRFKNSTTVALGTYNQTTGTFSELDTGSYTSTTYQWYYLKILQYVDNIVVQISTDGYSWVDVIDYDDTTYTSAGAVGLLCNSAWGEYNMFKVGELHEAKVL